MVMTAIIMLMPQMAMILMMLVNLDIVSKTSRCQRFWGRLLPIYPFHHRQSKIHPRKNHNYYYVCMSTAFIKGRRNPVGIHRLLTPVFANFQPAQLISISPSQKEQMRTVFHWSHITVMFLSAINQHSWKGKTFLLFSILKYSCWFFFHIKGSAVYFLVVCPKSN